MSVIETIRGRETRVTQLSGDAASILARAEQLTGLLATFDTVAAMAASDILGAGMTAKTLGYYAVGDGGDATYDIMASVDFGGATNGYSDHTLQNGLVASLYKTTGLFFAEQWGVNTGVESSARLQACAEAARVLNNDGALPVTLIMQSSPNLKNMVTIGDSTAAAFNIDFSLSRPIAVTGGNLSASNPMFKFEIDKSIIRLGLAYLNKICAGFWFYNCGRSWAYHPIANRFIGYGIKLSGGAMGNFVLYEHGGSEWERDDPEYPLGETSFVYDGLIVDCADCNIVGGGVGWAKRCIYVGSSAANNWFIRVHPFNGNPDYADPGVVLRTDPVVVYSDAGSKTYWSECYFDNGFIKDATSRMQIMNCEYLIIPERINISAPYIRVMTNADTSLDRFSIHGTKARVGFYSGNFTTVDTNHSYITTNSADFAGNGSFTHIGQQVNFLNISDVSAPDIQYTHRSTGTIWQRFITAQGAVPATDIQDIYIGAGEFKGNAAFVNTGLKSSGYGIGSAAVLSGSALSTRTGTVTMNGPAGRIAFPSAAGSATWSSFTFNNSEIGLNDTIDITQKGGTNVYLLVPVKPTGSGTCTVHFATTGGTATDAPNFDFTICRGPTA